VQTIKAAEQAKALLLFPKEDKSPKTMRRFVFHKVYEGQISKDGEKICPS
jgi:hypothetical protein